MDIQIQSIHFDADRKLISFIEEKVGKLTHFYDGIIRSEIFLRLDKSDSSTNKVAEIKLNVPGTDLYVKRQCRTFEEAIDTGIDAISRQVKKHKEKLRGK
ncbi:MAG: ribosome-associated translation inhibitor RaiA [Bacteroidia bacterium]|jgi:putative sigma-54 modulation protein|nr:ribosome-associated translation inhibitor RaiA [Bacteroidia bacterium]